MLIGGEQETYIRDETPTDDPLSRDLTTEHRSAITMFGESLYLMRVQLECPSSDDSECDLAHHVDVVIDLNDDGEFNEFEKRVHRRSPIDSKSKKHGYDLQILIPAIDGTNTKVGPHRMRISLMRSEIHRKACGDTDFSETREYTAHIIPKVTYAGKARKYLALLSLE